MKGTWGLGAATLIGGTLTILLLSPRTSPARQGSALIKGVPHLVQKPDFCGEACVAMYLKKLGHDVDQDFVFEMSGVDPRLGRGAVTREMVRALKNIGFKPGQVWYEVDASRAREEILAQWRILLTDLQRGIPSIVCTRYDPSPGSTEHFRLILGFDGSRQEVIYHEPAEEGGAYRRMALGEFLEIWPLKYETRKWLVIRMTLEEGNIREGKAPGGYTAGEFSQHIRVLRSSMPQGFTMVVEPPFLVLGDEEARVVQRRSRGTVRWAVEHLKRLYFSRDPQRILNIWLFRDQRSYEGHTWQLFRDRPDTPFGYYSPEHGLIMNIATGGGTLVHEIVHPFMESNFPDCPSWFNEGLGSLYEQCAERDGKMVGLTNWRLPGLQQAIRAGTVPSFKELTGTSSREFYGEDPGTHYSQARYLCYYLQERGLLQRYYHSFVRDHEEDPTGYRTLQRVLGVRDMEEFQREWERWVLTLRLGR